MGSEIGRPSGLYRRSELGNTRGRTDDILQGRKALQVEALRRETIGRQHFRGPEDAKGGRFDSVLCCTGAAPNGNGIAALRFDFCFCALASTGAHMQAYSPSKQDRMPDKVVPSYVAIHLSFVQRRVRFARVVQDAKYQRKQSRGETDFLLSFGKLTTARDANWLATREWLELQR